MKKNGGGTGFIYLDKTSILCYVEYFNWFSKFIVLEYITLRII